ncbi:MAG: hypothetical protein AAF907_13175, partial [Planctomycetota bacterium]
MPPLTLSEPHGDLIALEGSTVVLALTPNQPIRTAELHRIPLDPDAAPVVVPLAFTSNEEGEERLNAVVTLDEPGTYRVHLVGEETGFDNPFAPRSELRPLPDAPPTVAFRDLPDGAASGLLLPPDDLLDLLAEASDDLPLDTVEQHVSINGGPWQPTPLPFAPLPTTDENGEPLDQTGRRRASAWRWDLLPLELKTSDEVRTKLVAVDRKGQIGESGTLRALIAGEDFDPNRHAAAERKQRLVDAVAAFAAALAEQRTLADAAFERTKQNPDDEPAVAAEYAVIRDLRARRGDAAAALIATLSAALPQQAAGADALELELLAALASDIGHRPAADPTAAAARGESADVIRDAARKDFKQAAEDAAAAESFARRFAAHNFLAAVAEELAAAHRHQNRVVETPDLSWARLARQEAVVAGRLIWIEGFADRHRDRLDDRVQREIDALREGLAELRSRLDRVLMEGEVAENLDDEGRP